MVAIPVNPRIVVIILTMNQRETLLRCLHSLYAIKEPPFSVLVWDNGSTDDTLASVKQTFPDVLYHYHQENLGVASGRNAAARLAMEHFRPTHLLFLDNDMLLEPDFVSALSQAFADENVGQAQAKLRFMHDRERLNDGGGSRINFLIGQTMPVGYREIDRGQYDTVRKCIACGGAMMVRADVFEQLGGFDSTFDPFGPEDIDFSLRLSKAGFDALYVPSAVAYHEVSHTFGKGYSADYARHKARHWLKFMQRHASLRQKLAFYLIGAPYLVLSVSIREGRKGNFQAVIGLFRGVLGYFTPTSKER